MTAFLFRRRLLRVVALAGLAGTAALAAAPGYAKSDIAPYIEVQQVLDADIGGGGDMLTYTSVAAGVDARVTTRRVDAQISYRYERRIDWNDQLSNEDVHSGLISARMEVAPEVLSIDAGAIAARSRLDPRGSAFGFGSADDRNIAQVYGAYAGPSLSTHVGPVAVNANYHVGYVKVDDQGNGGSGLPGGSVGGYDSSVSHDASVSVGMEPGRLPVGWTVGAGWQHEKSKPLDQTFDGRYVRGDVVVPVSRTLAVTGGVGYEKIESKQDDFVRGPGGVPVTTPGGDLIADKTKPRLLTYDESGLIWDVGVIWRPSPRTELTARVGKRYGDVTVVGTLKYQINKDYAFSAVVYDSVTTFGRLVVSDINGLKPGFKVKHHGFNEGLSGIGGCVFGNDPGSGRCFNNAFQSISNATFRNRGIGLLLSGSRGAWDIEVGAGYARRKYLAANTGAFALHDAVDQSATIEGRLGRRLTRTSGIDFDAYASWYDSGIGGNDPVFSTGVSATYYRSFLLDRLQAEASVGIYNSKDGSESSTVASALLGLRYGF